MNFSYQKKPLQLGNTSISCAEEHNLSGTLSNRCWCYTHAVTPKHITILLNFCVQSLSSLSTDTLSCGNNTCWCTWNITKYTPNFIFQLRNRKSSKPQWEWDAGEKQQGKEAYWTTDSPRARSREMGLLGIPRFTRGPKSDFLLFKSRLKYNKRLPA